MKVLCVDNKNLSLLITVGKWYEVISEYTNSYAIISDRNTFLLISKTKFKTIEELRSEKLKTVLGSIE